MVPDPIPIQINWRASEIFESCPGKTWQQPNTIPISNLSTIDKCCNQMETV